MITNDIVKKHTMMQEEDYTSSSDSDGMWDEDQLDDLYVWRSLCRGEVEKLHTGQKINLFEVGREINNVSMKQNIERVLPNFLKAVIDAKVKVLKLYMSDSSDTIMTYIADFLRKAKYLRVFGIKNITITSSNLRILSSGLSSSVVEDLYINNFVIANDAHRRLFSDTTPRLKNLTLTNGKLLNTYGDVFLYWLKKLRFKKFIGNNIPFTHELMNALATNYYALTVTFTNTTVDMHSLTNFFESSFIPKQMKITNLCFSVCDFYKDTAQYLIKNVHRLQNLTELVLDMSFYKKRGGGVAQDEIGEDIIEEAYHEMCKHNILISMKHSSDTSKYEKTMDIMRIIRRLQNIPNQIDDPATNIYPTVIVGTNSFSRSAVCNAVRNTPRNTLYQDERLMFTHDEVEDITGFEFEKLEAILYRGLVKPSDKPLGRMYSAAAAADVLPYLYKVYGDAVDQPPRTFSLQPERYYPNVVGSVTSLDDDSIFPSPTIANITAIDLFPEFHSDDAAVAKATSISLLTTEYEDSSNTIVFVSKFAKGDPRTLIRQNEYCAMAGVDKSKTMILYLGDLYSEREVRDFVYKNARVRQMLSISDCLFAIGMHHYAVGGPTQQKKMVLSSADMDELSARCGINLESYNDLFVARRNALIDLVNYFMDIRVLKSTNGSKFYILDYDKFNRVIHSAAMSWIKSLPVHDRQTFMSAEDDFIADASFFDRVWKGALTWLENRSLAWQDVQTLSSIDLDEDSKEIILYDLRNIKERVYHI